MCQSSLVDAPVPEPGPDEILIRVRACGVCRTDLHMVDRELTHPRLPLIPGHEIIGTVVRRAASSADSSPADCCGG